jgi:hypothetical protein
MGLDCGPLQRAVRSPSTGSLICSLTGGPEVRVQPVLPVVVFLELQYPTRSYRV